MASVFDNRNISYSLEKIADFINGSGSGVVAGFGSSAAKIIVEVLEQLETKMREHGLDPGHSEMPTALHAARELQKYVNDQQSEIANRTEARIFLRSLRTDIGDLKQYEQDMEKAS
jgi:hypothetical protein